MFEMYIIAYVERYNTSFVVREHVTQPKEIGHQFDLISQLYIPSITNSSKNNPKNSGSD